MIAIFTAGGVALDGEVRCGDVVLGDTHIRFRRHELCDELFDAARRERAVRVGRLRVVQVAKRVIVSAVDGPAIGVDELMQFVAGQQQCQFGLIYHHVTITRRLSAGRCRCSGR